MRRAARAPRILENPELHSKLILDDSYKRVTRYKGALMLDLSPLFLWSLGGLDAACSFTFFISPLVYLRVIEDLQQAW